MPDIEQVEYVTFEAVDTLDAVPTSVRGAWRGLDYVMWNRLGPRVGDNRVIPGVAGRLAVAREIDELKFSQRMRIIGRNDVDGTPFADQFEGALANLDYWVDNVLSYLPERSVTYHRRDGSTKTGAVTVEDWDYSIDPASAGDVILLVIPLTVAAGSLTLTGS